MGSQILTAFPCFPHSFACFLSIWHLLEPKWCQTHPSILRFSRLFAGQSMVHHVLSLSTAMSVDEDIVQTNVAGFIVMWVVLFFHIYFLHWQHHLKMVDLTLSDSLKVMTCHWYKIIVCCPHLLTIFSSNRLQLIFDVILSKDVLFLNMCHLTWPVRTRQCLFIFCINQKLTQLKSRL